MQMLNSVKDLAIFGAAPIFDEPRPNSGLYLASKSRFFGYAESIFKNRQLTNNGPLVRELEARLALLHGTKHCIAFCSGFLAGATALRLLALPGRSEAIALSATYRKTPEIIFFGGLTPFYVDIDPKSFSMTPAQVEPYISEKTAVVLATHPPVNSADAAGLEKLCQKHGIPLLFDSVEPSCGSISGRKVGSFGDAEFFSIHASKFINAFEGGYITTNNSTLAGALKLYRAFGFVAQDTITSLGINAKLNEMHAAMALACLDEIDSQIEKNKAVYSTYKKALDNLPLSLVEYGPDSELNFKNIVVRLEDKWPFSRDDTLALLNSEKMLSRSYYAPLLHSLPHSVSFPTAPLPNSIWMSEKHIILPSGAHVSPDDVRVIGEFLKFIYANASEINARLKGGAVK